MAKQSKFFRVAVEGGTTDGRTIERGWLVEMARNYNPATYAARVNMEHIRGVTADKPFKAYGDVLALQTQEIDLELNGKIEKRLALYAQIEPTDDLVAMNADKQKLFTSIEVSPNFAGKGQAYLMGLAVTDSPASLGTEMLQFAAGLGANNPLTARKHDPANLFTASVEAKLEFEDAPAAAASEADGLFAAAKAFFTKFAAGEPAAAPVVPPPAPANDNAKLSAIVDTMSKINDGVAALSRDLRADFAKLRGEHDALKASIDTTDRSTEQRPVGTGAKQYTATDC
ncbi:MAG: hypothetical protein JWQ16_1746 [Novosphingobium sp.]|nr:hypothetical protein [Novosphingobium sp.]